MIYDRIQSDIKEAMKARDSARLEVLRYLNSEIKNVGINEKVVLGDEVCLRVLTRLAKQRRDVIEESRKAGRADVAAREEAELKVLEGYLPRGLSEAEVLEEVRRVIQETGAASRRDLGKVMKAALQKLAGRTDGQAIQKAASTLLS